MQLFALPATQLRQSVAISAQTIQSLKMLQFSHDELHDFLADQAERNPLIELMREDPSVQKSVSGKDSSGIEASESNAPGVREDTSPRPMAGNGAGGESAGRQSSGNADGGFRSLEETCQARTTLREHLYGQLAGSIRNDADKRIAAEIIESLDADGYMRRNLDEVSRTTGADAERIAAVLAEVQKFDPAGVAARDLPECLRLQLSERGPVSPAMAVLLDNLKLLADFKMAALANRCGVPVEDIQDMLREIRTLDPRPGLRFDTDPVIPAIPDVMVQRLSDGSCAVELNAQLLPRILVNNGYYSRISSGTTGKVEKQYVMDCLRNANWLTRNLEQRAQTILKVASEIVAHQEKFLDEGVDHLRPLCLKDVAQSIGMHESTVCRAISNKYMMTPRGMFEMKYFFSNSIASSDGGDEHSSETVRHRIKELIDGEQADIILSDDDIVTELKERGIFLARRTVAKYREMMNIPSSIKRRRMKASGFS